MPQPVRREGFIYDPNPMAIRESPATVVEMAVALNICSMLEVHIAWVVAKLLGQKAARAGLAMYRSIESDNARTAVLRGAAKTVLSKRDNDLFTVLLTFVDRSRKGRNKIAHNLWCYSSQYPDSLIMRDARDEAEANFVRARMHGNRNLYRDLKTLERKVPFVELRRWTITDFQNITEETKRILTYLLRFWWPGEKSRTESSTKLERQRLRQVPEIREALQRLGEARKKAREAVKPPPQTQRKARRPKSR